MSPLLLLLLPAVGVAASATLWWMRASRPREPELALGALGFVAIDTETTGLDPVGDALVAVAAVPFLEGRPRLVSADGHSFTDHASKRVSLINLATLAEIERRMGHPIDPVRFRANLYVADLPAWAEFDWVGKIVTTGDVQLTAVSRIDRCAATNVDPETGRRDLRIPDGLRAAYGHIDCGIYLRAETAGTLVKGATIALA